MLLVGVGGVPYRGGVDSEVGSGVSCLCQLGGGTPVSLRLQHVCRFIAVPFAQGTHPAVWFWQSIAECLSIAAFTFLCPGNSTPQFFSCWTSAQGFSIDYCVSSIVARENPPFAILAIFNDRRMSDCSSCT